jgi:hypothetical protein
VLLDLEPRHACIHVGALNQVPYRRVAKRAREPGSAGDAIIAALVIQVKQISHPPLPTAAPPCRLDRPRWLPGSPNGLAPRFTTRRARYSCSLNVINTFRSRLFRHVRRWLTLATDPKRCWIASQAAPTSRSRWSGRRTSRASLQERSRGVAAPTAHSTPMGHQWLIPSVYAARCLSDAHGSGSVPIPRSRTIPAAGYSEGPSGQEPSTLTNTVYSSNAWSASCTFGSLAWPRSSKKNR